MHKMNHTTVAILTALGLILGCWQEQIALFLKDDPQPIRVFPVSVELLPQADQMDLKAGIPIHSSAELQKLLEDFLS